MALKYEGLRRNGRKRGLILLLAGTGGCRKKIYLNDMKMTVVSHGDPVGGRIKTQQPGAILVDRVRTCNRSWTQLERNSTLIEIVDGDAQATLAVGCEHDRLRECTD